MTFDAPEPWQPPAPVNGAGAPADAPPERLRLRPPVGIPRPPVRRLPSVLLSVALHALVVLLILTPVIAPAVIREVAGAGDSGPAGGGGGGARGTGGDNGGWNVRERLHFIQVAPPANAAATPAPVVPPPPPVTPPPVPPPPTPAVPPPPAAAPTPAPAAPAAAAGVSAPTPGSGGGTGADGSSGSGPGSGGGVGAGTGTGRGSGTGPGTGGAGGVNYAPQLIEMFVPPLPLPRKVAGTTVRAVFDVDSTGRVLGVEFTPTPDGGYNRKLREVFSAFRFRPGTRPDGTPVRATAPFEYEL